MQSLRPDGRVTELHTDREGSPCLIYSLNVNRVKRVKRARGQERGAGRTSQREAGEMSLCVSDGQKSPLLMC